MTGVVYEDYEEEGVEGGLEKLVEEDGHIEEGVLLADVVGAWSRKSSKVGVGCVKVAEMEDRQTDVKYIEE